MTIVEKLDELKEIEEEIKVHMAEYEQKIVNAMPEEVSKRIEWLRKQSTDFLEPINMLRSQLEKEIKTAVLENRQSVKGESYQAVYTKGKITWDTKALTGYALAHPEIEELKKTGKPSVSIRK